MDSKSEPLDRTDEPIKNWDDARAAIHSFVHERDWEQFHHLKDLIVGLNVEAGELLEHTLWQDSKALDASMETGNARREKILDEVADVLFFVIRILDKLDADPWSTLQGKLSKNAIKYPVERARGRSDKYTAYED
jgi:dCTP diphosphatase